jgi:hypothetical protein
MAYIQREQRQIYIYMIRHIIEEGYGYRIGITQPTYDSLTGRWEASIEMPTHDFDPVKGKRLGSIVMHNETQTIEATPIKEVWNNVSEHRFDLKKHALRRPWIDIQDPILAGRLYLY